MVAIGIDLGTTYSCVAVWKDGEAQVIANKHGNNATPSYVAFTNKGRLIGEDAKNQAAVNPWNTIFAAKRLIGRRYDDLEVQMDLRHWPFRVANDNGKPKIAVEYKGKKTYFAPEEISSMVLYRMKQIAESYLGTVVKDAVITVPAYFSDAQRLATKTAGIIAGLNVIRIINEPTAAALAYGLNRNIKGEKNLLIYDLGGGTVDVSVLTISEGSMYEVKATVGDLKLGGEDFDNRIVAYLSEDFRKQYLMPILPNEKALRRLKTAAEIAKRSLSSTLNTVIKIESICNGIDYQGVLSRSLFEELCLDLFIDTLQPVEKAIESANLKKEDIQEIILVGGSTRIPKIRTMLEEYFGKPVTTSINPDEAVAYGAAIQAAILADVNHQKIKDLLLVDVVPLTLGVEIVRGAMLPIVERNSRIPCRHSREITTLEDYQTAMTIEIFEGERTMTKDNYLLGTFNLTGIPPAPRGIPKVDVTFDIDANGILTVSARDQSTGSTNSLVVRNENRLTQDEIEKMIAEAERFKEEDKEKKSSVEARNQLETYVYSVKLTVSEQRKKLTEEELSTMTTECQNALCWLEDNMDRSKDEYIMKMTEYMRKWAKIMNKFYEEKLRHRTKRHKSESQFLKDLQEAVAASIEEMTASARPGPSKT